MKKSVNYLEYKGYHTRIEYDYESSTLHGKIEGIDDLVVFENENASEIAQEFHAAVDDYLSFCEEVGKQPDKEYKGVFNVRVSPELHRRLSLIAYKTAESLNSVVELALENYVKNASASMEEINYSSYSTNPTTNMCFTSTIINNKTWYQKAEEAC